MGRSNHGIDWVDRDEQLQPEFFSEATPIFVEETAIRDLPISVTESGKPQDTEENAVSVRFTSEGFAEEVSDEAEPTDDEPLEAMPLSHKFGASDWGSAFSEIHTRAHNLENHSKVTAIRYVQSGNSKKVSCLPSTVDFLADVQIVARKVLSPALYKLWKKVYYEDFGKNADRLPESVQMTIQQRCGTAWKKAGLLPFHKYWHIRTPADSICAVSFELVLDARDARNQRRRAARKARSVITTLQAAA
jgi:hypothetical protein